jgi:hypothetical protein
VQLLGGKPLRGRAQLQFGHKGILNVPNEQLSHRGNLISEISIVKVLPEGRGNRPRLTPPSSLRSSPSSAPERCRGRDTRRVL